MAAQQAGDEDAEQGDGDDDGDDEREHGQLRVDPSNAAPR
jgi:hypothetical protein